MVQKGNQVQTFMDSKAKHDNPKVIAKVGSSNKVTGIEGIEAASEG